MNLRDPDFNRGFGCGFMDSGRKPSRRDGDIPVPVQFSPPFGSQWRENGDKSVPVTKE